MPIGPSIGVWKTEGTGILSKRLTKKDHGAGDVPDTGGLRGGLQGAALSWTVGPNEVCCRRNAGRRLICVYYWTMSDCGV